MVDKIRHALDALEPPICPVFCPGDMKWTRSTLIAPDTINRLLA